MLTSQLHAQAFVAKPIDAASELRAHLSLVAGMRPGPGMLLQLLPAQLLKVDACRQAPHHSTARHSTPQHLTHTCTTTGDLTRDATTAAAWQ